MAAKRNRWLVTSVLVVALGAFLTLSLLPILGGRSNNRPSAASTPGSTAQATDLQTELAERARGYELVLEREPDNETAILGLVETRIQLGDLAGVVEPLTKLADLNPEVTEYRVLLGQTKQALGDLEGAAQEYRTVLTSRPGDMKALQGLVKLLLDQDRPQAAVGLLEDTLATANETNALQTGSVDVTSVKLLLAEVYVQTDRFDTALDIYDEMIAAAADDFRPLLAKALVLREMGKTDEAQPLFEQAEAIAPAQFRDQIRQLAAGDEPAPSAVTPGAEPEAGDAEAGAAPDAATEAPAAGESEE
ncbi:MAG: tetratricopeptide repeat protein [Leptolyngbya sp.]|nr:tetratricopeptide repeat protein [Leptolyngbya sp.]